MLDGQGADEIMAGYSYYFSALASHLLYKMDIKGFLALRATYEKEIGPFPLSLPSIINCLMPKVLRRVALSASRLMPFGILRTPATKIIRSELLQRYGDFFFNEASLAVSINKALYQDVKSRSLPALLRYEDRNSMAHSIESRVPFLDYRLVEFLFMLPEEWKIRGVTTKYILRQGMKGILPDEIRNRKDKIGFKSPPGLTFDFVRQNYISLVDNRTDHEKRWFNTGGIEQLLNSADRSLENEFALWRLINTKLWVRQFWN